MDGGQKTITNDEDDAGATDVEHFVFISETIDNYCILLNGNNDFAKKTTWGMMQNVSVFIILMYPDLIIIK